jgi:hypothetical protein
MCHERYWRQRRHQDAESRGIWQEFDRTTPIAEPEPPEVADPEVTEPERAEEAMTSEQ